VVPAVTANVTRLWNTLVETSSLLATAVSEGRLVPV
jgi:hypothetical protein